MSPKEYVDKLGKWELEQLLQETRAALAEMERKKAEHWQTLMEKANTREFFDFYGEEVCINSTRQYCGLTLATTEFHLSNGSVIVINERDK